MRPLKSTCGKLRCTGKRQAYAPDDPKQQRPLGDLKIDRSQLELCSIGRSVGPLRCRLLNYLRELLVRSDYRKSEQSTRRRKSGAYGAGAKRPIACCGAADTELPQTGSSIASSLNARGRMGNDDGGLVGS